MTPATLEPAVVDDVPQLVGLLGLLFSIESDFSPDARRQREGLLRLIDDRERALVLVARGQDGRAVGMASVQLVVSTAEGGWSAWIEDVIVAPTHRRAGTGRRLLEHALQWAQDRGATRAQLLADLENLPALAFYETLGWQALKVGVRRIALKP
jgi:GNAT superfamily N-acetyltransferase